MRQQKGKATREKIIQLEEINQKVLAKGGRLKRYRQSVKQYRQNKTFQNYERKFINNWEGVTRKHTNNRMQKKPNDFGLKYGNQKTWRKGWMDKQYYTRTRRIWRRPQSGNTHRFTQNDAKKNIKLENARPWWNTWFLVQEIHHHSRQTSARNEQMLIRSTGTKLDDQRKDHFDTKEPKQRNYSKQLQTDNLPTNDVETTNCTNKRKYLLLTKKPWIVPWRTERMPRRI